MAKEALKQKISKRQRNKCALSKVKLSPVPKLNDTDRIQPKAAGGTYTDENTRVAEPRAHMARHGILRERSEELNHVKALFDDRVQTMKLKLKINNQRLAYERRVDDSFSPEIDAFLVKTQEPVDARLDELDKKIAKTIKEYKDPLVQAALKVAGMGPISVAALTVYVDLVKANSPSSLWKYTGLHVASHQRYIKGEASGGNKTLRTVLWNTANSMVKNKKSGYRQVYDRTKARLAASEKMVQTRNTEGKLIESMWKDTKPSHRHGAALRQVIKYLLVDYWLVGRKLANLPTKTIYAEGVLGHTHIETPQDHGWPASE